MKGVIAVGNNDTQVTEPGSVTEVSSDNSQESATLVADDVNDGDKFGYSVALSPDGSRALVGAFRDDDLYGTESGAAYLFQQTADGWRQETKLVAPSGNVEEWSGWDVTLNADGTTALVSAFLADTNGDGSGAVQVFTRTSGNWQHQSRLTGNDTTEGDRFGSGVALADAGDTALVGAWRASDKSGTGVAYVFDNNGATWTQTARIKPDSQNAGAAFGRSVALTADGTIALIGADGESAAYLFERSGETWQQLQRFTDPTETQNMNSSGDRSGGGVALSGDGSTAFVGTSQSVSVDTSGYTAVYRRQKSGWTREAVLRPADRFPGYNFGAALSSTATGETLLVGASNSNQYGENSGAATLFQRGTDGWSVKRSLKAFQTDSYDDFGITVALTDDSSTGLIWARDAETKGSGESGAAYLFSDLS